MAINFPTSPSTNDTFTAGSITYKWDGAKWIGLGVTPTDKLIEGSNKLEIDGSNNLVWTGFSAQFDGANSPAGRDTRISQYGSLLVATTDDIISSARCSIDSGNGNIATVGGLSVGANIDLTDSTVDLYSQTTNAASKTFQLFSDIGGAKTEKVYLTANGVASFSSQVVIGSGSAANSEYGLIAYANTNTTSNKSAVYARNIGGGRNFTGDSAAGATTFEVFDTGRVILTTALGDRQLQLSGTEADLWLTSTGGGATTWRLLGSTGGSTHQFRIYDNTNSGDRLTINSSGRVRLPAVPGVAGSNLANLQIESDGNLCTTTSIRAAKTNISPLADTSWLFDLNPVTFNWRTKTENENGTLNWGEEADGGTQYGLIAEEVEEVKDDFCYYNNDGELSGVHYDRLVAPLLKVVQQQKEEIETLKARLDAAGL